VKMIEPLYTDMYMLADVVGMDLTRDGQRLTGNSDQTVKFGNSKLKVKCAVLSSRIGPDHVSMIVETMHDVGLFMTMPLTGREEAHNVYAAILNLPMLPQRGLGLLEAAGDQKGAAHHRALVKPAEVATFLRLGSGAWSVLK